MHWGQMKPWSTKVHHQNQLVRKKTWYTSLKINQNTSDVWSWFSSALGGSASAFWPPPMPGVLESKRKGDSSLIWTGYIIIGWITYSLINVILNYFYDLKNSLGFVHYIFTIMIDHKNKHSIFAITCYDFNISCKNVLLFFFFFFN